MRREDDRVQLFNAFILALERGKGVVLSWEVATRSDFRSVSGFKQTVSWGSK